MKWRDVIKNIKKYGYHVPFSIPRDELPYPSQKFKFEKMIGEPEGQEADFRRNVGKKYSLHVKVFKDHFEIHRDKYHPKKNPLKHLLFDAPEIIAAIVMGIILTFTATKLTYDLKKKKDKGWYLPAIYYSIAILGAVLMYLFLKVIRETIDNANYRVAQLKIIRSS